MVLVGILVLLGIIAAARMAYRRWYAIRNRQRNAGVVVITGASSGIGEATALKYARRRNVKLVLAARREDRLQSVADACRKLGAESVLVVKADMAVEAECKQLVERTVHEFGALNVLVLNAGVSCITEFAGLESLGPYRRVMEVNYWGPVALTHYALPHLRKSRGIICVVSSLAGKIATATRSGYSPTKFALHGFFDALRCEVGSEVQITLVCPGFVVSEIHDKAFKGTKHTHARRDLAKFMSAEECAGHLVRAVDEGKREELLTLAGKVGACLLPFVPELLDAVAKHKARAVYTE